MTGRGKMRPGSHKGRHHRGGATRPRIERDPSNRAFAVVDIEVELPDGSTVLPEQLRIGLDGSNLSEADLDAQVAERVRYHVEQRDLALEASGWLDKYGA